MTEPTLQPGDPDQIKEGGDNDPVPEDEVPAEPEPEEN